MPAAADRLERWRRRGRGRRPALDEVRAALDDDLDTPAAVAAIDAAAAAGEGVVAGRGAARRRPADPPDRRRADPV